MISAPEPFIHRNWPAQDCLQCFNTFQRSGLAKRVPVLDVLPRLVRCHTDCDWHAEQAVGIAGDDQHSHWAGLHNGLEQEYPCNNMAQMSERWERHTPPLLSSTNDCAALPVEQTWLTTLCSSVHASSIVPFSKVGQTWSLTSCKYASHFQQQPWWHQCTEAGY